MADQHIQPAPGGISSPAGGSVGARAAAHRPGMVTFAAVMMFLVAGFEALSALLAFAGTGWWVTDAGNLVYANFFLWGILDTIIALIALYAGIDLLRGGAYGLVMGYLFAGLGAIRWLFVIPAAPVLAVVVIALCVMVIYGIAKYSEQLEST
jgi:hypothetical protein